MGSSRWPWVSLFLLSCGRNAEEARPGDGGATAAGRGDKAVLDAPPALDVARGDDAGNGMAADAGADADAAVSALACGSRWTSLSLPSGFDIVSSLDGASASDFFAVTVRGDTGGDVGPFPPLVPMVWHVQGNVVTDVTPAPLQIDGGSITGLHMVALAADEYWLTGILEGRAVLYDVKGTSAADITPAAFGPLGGGGGSSYADLDVLRRTSNGDVYLGGTDANDEAALVHEAGGVFTSIAVPHDTVDAGHSGDAVSGVAELAGAVYVSTQSGRLFRVDDDKLTFLTRAAPPAGSAIADIDGLAATSTDLFVLDSVGLETSHVQRWDGGAFVTEEVPTIGGDVFQLVKLQDDTVAALHVTDIWVRSSDASWRGLPPLEAGWMWGAAAGPLYMFLPGAAPQGGGALCQLP